VLVSQDEPVPVWEMTGRSQSLRALRNPNGVMRQYVNEKDCWNQLCEAGRDARLLNLVPALDFEDRRNDEPREYLLDEIEPRVFRGNGVDFDPIDLDWLTPPRWAVRFDDDEVDYPQVPQPFHLEVWAEKTTMDDILEPMCQRLGVNLITGAGHASLTMVDKFMERANASGLPVCILYIADADKSGKDMPIAAARKIEHRHRHPENAHLDVRLRRIVLTQEQIDEFDLPKSPIDGLSVELDALEAVRPGEFGRIVEEAIGQYHDPYLDEKVEEAFDVLQAKIDSANAAAITKAERLELDALDQEREALTAGFNSARAAQCPRRGAVRQDPGSPTDRGSSGLRTAGGRSRRARRR